MQIIETELKLDGGVAGTLVEPEVCPSPKQLVVILHGLGGHRDYCYQKQMGHELPRQLGICTFRLDFRNCGASDDVPDPKRGRSVGGTDFEDLNNVYKHFSKDYQLLAIVGHSRGASNMFLWALRHPEIFVPYLINCSGRFHTWNYRDRVFSEEMPNYQRDGGYWLTAKRHGTYAPQWISMAEVDEFSSYDSHNYADINPETQILTIFGSLDHQVPVRDAAYWSNLFGARHTLNIIMNADHNFYGGRDKNGKKISYNPDVVAKTVEWLSADAAARRWYEANKVAEVIPRWHSIEGVYNMRDFGGYDSVRPGILFRSAALGGISAKGKAQIRDLGIKHIFDLRSDAEAESDEGLVIENVNIIRNPVYQKRDLSPDALVKRYGKMMDTNENRFHKAYLDILRDGTRSYRNIMICLRDNENEGVLVHCTAGKDRTGLFCAILLSLLGVDDYTVSRDYELTTVGYAEPREILYATLKETLVPSGISIDSIEHMLSSKFESMQATLHSLKAEWGSAYNYFLDACKLSADDLAIIKKNLLNNPRL